MSPILTSLSELLLKMADGFISSGEFECFRFSICGNYIEHFNVMDPQEDDGLVEVSSCVQAAVIVIAFL